MPGTVVNTGHEAGLFQRVLGIGHVAAPAHARADTVERPEVLARNVGHEVWVRDEPVGVPAGAVAVRESELNVVRAHEQPEMVETIGQVKLVTQLLVRRTQGGRIIEHVGARNVKPTPRQPVPRLPVEDRRLVHRWLAPGVDVTRIRIEHRHRAERNAVVNRAIDRNRIPDLREVAGLGKTELSYEIRRSAVVIERQFDVVHVVREEPVGKEVDLEVELQRIRIGSNDRVHGGVDGSDVIRQIVNVS